MVKSSSRPRKASKFTIDLGPEIDRVVKKKLHTRDVKIKKQRVIIKALEQERNELRSRKSGSSDLKMKKQKLYVSSLKTIIDDLTSKLEASEKRVPTNEQQRAMNLGSKTISINDKTIEEARKRILKGKPISNMQSRTKTLIHRAGKWDEFHELESRVRLGPRLEELVSFNITTIF